MAILSVAEPLFDDVLIRPAQPGEEDLVLDLRAEAAAWLHGRGITQWPPRFSTRSVQKQIATGEALLVEDALHPIGKSAAGVVVSVLDTEADLYDSTGPWRERAMAGVLHRGELVRDPRSDRRTGLAGNS